jgi:outer membrane protein OmpA-like peptidoglycan-associated protein
VPNYPQVSDILNTSYVEDLAKKAPTLAPSKDVTTFSATQNLGEVVSKRSWSINFQTGSASFDPTATAQLEKLAQDLLTTELVIELDGHTDNTGNSTVNQPLSQQRADAVKKWLMAKSSVSFPPERFIVKGFGDSKPVADNGTDAGRAKNRRVDVLMGTGG